jgi:homoserine O-acetyltransferase/O-succinyltransferase
MYTDRELSVTKLAAYVILAATLLAGDLSVSAQKAAPVCRSNESFASTYKAQSCDWVLRGFSFADASSLPELRLHYTTLGESHRDNKGNIDNAVLLLHWTGASGAALLSAEFQQSLYAPGKPLNAQRYFLIVPDNLGHGQSSKPSDGLRSAFPHYNYGDLVSLQHRLVTEGIGIKRLHAIVGLSMGGMNAWQWVERYPEAVNAVMPVVSLPVKVSGRNLLWRRLAINWIRNDPGWMNGNYDHNPNSFAQAWQLATLMIEGVPHLQKTLTDRETTEVFIAGLTKQADAMDANDVLYSIDSSRDYDPESKLATITTPIWALNFSDDEFNPDTLQILETLSVKVPHLQYVVQQGTSESHGHLTMAHPSLWASHVADFMKLADVTAKAAPGR